MSQLETRTADPAAGPTPRLYPPAVWALVLSVLTLGGIGSVVGIVLGLRARRHVLESGERGSGLATAAVVVGIVTLLLALGFWIAVTGGTGSSGGSTGGHGVGRPNGG